MESIAIKMETEHITKGYAPLCLQERHQPEKNACILFGTARESEKRVKAFYHDLDKKIELEIGLEPTTY